MGTRHLSAALLAFALLAAALAAGHGYAVSLETRSVHTLATARFSQKNLGSSLQQVGLAQPDLLPIYGSSEFEIPDPYEPARVFRLYPTGFQVFTVGGLGAESLIYVQRLAAAGPALKGRKVVISLTSGNFYEPSYSEDYYAGNFSPLHAYELAFGDALSAALKQRAARRMLDYSTTLQNDPLLRFGLQALADGSTPARLAYAAAWPLGRLRTMVLQLQDEWATASYILEHPQYAPGVERRPGPLDWRTLEANAQRSYLQRAGNNPFGFENSQWNEFGERWSREQGRYADERFLRSVEQSTSWTDLDLLLQTLAELDARPLIVVLALPGSYYDYLGISAQARHVLYDRLDRAVARYRMPLADFAQYDEAPFFFYDPGGHLSSIAWIQYSLVLDSFYHDAPIPGPVRP